MKALHVLRKPCSEPTVAANVLRWGTGAMNIDGCRVEGAPPSVPQPVFNSPTGRTYGMKTGEGRNGEMSHAQGRWPANLILDGSDELVVGLFPNVKAGVAVRHRSGGKNCHSDTDKPPMDDMGYGDSGSAARFFKHFPTLSTNNTGSHMNTELADYLRTLISPEERTLTTTEGGECVYLHVAAPDSFPWADHADASVHGLTVESSSLAGQPVWLPEAMRVLKPGAHLLLAAPDEEPTGHTGACIAEDAGFEVRDAILWVYGEGAGDRLHYTAKAARSEREEGLFDSDFEYGQQDESRKEGNPGGDNPRNRGLTKRKNVHPTVKPVEVMVRLLAGVPKDCGPVLDPFLGSGTTLLACIETGHDGIGIEREREYLEIADARVRHRDYETAGWNRAVIHSDAAPEAPDGKETAAETSLDDFFGL